MPPLIRHVKVSKRTAVVGESIKVDVEIDPGADVLVNNVHGASQFLQFENAGRHSIVVSASREDRIEQVEERVKIGEVADGLPAPPVIRTAVDRYRPRTVHFSLLNEDPTVTAYRWDFGDGRSETTNRPTATHDYTDALDPTELTTSFDVRVTARRGETTVSEATRTVALLCVYAENKLRRGVLTPYVDVLAPMTLKRIGVICGLTIRNMEDEELSFSAELHEWLTTEHAGVSKAAFKVHPSQASASAMRAITAVPTSSTSHGRESAKIFVSRALAIPELRAPLAIPHDDAVDIRVPPRSAVTLVRVFDESQFAAPVFGVAIHLQGHGTCSKLPAIASAYVEARLPLEWGGQVIHHRVVDALSALDRVKAVTGDTFTHELLRGLSATRAAHPPFDTIRDRRPTTTVREPHTVLSGEGPAHDPSLMDLQSSVVSSIHDLLDPQLLPPVDAVSQPGAECDPDNLPDDLAEGMVCQRTAEVAWRYVPGRVLNAKKGDVVLSHDGQHMIGQLLQQITPPQFYSHSGIMSKNHIEVRHSTASEERLLDQAKGGDGFDPAALKYLWPGTITQTVDKAAYSEWLTSPEGRPYAIEGFYFDADAGSSTIVYPLVVKPPPFEETHAIRRTLHAIADAALEISGHYRFYCYTDPAAALEPGYVAGDEAGWARGTVPTVCSSLIWLAAQRAGVRLEGPNQRTAPADLEPTDTAAGAAVDASTRDGLYLYTASERQAAARWLYHTIYDLVYAQAGWLGRLLTDAPDDYANQICNTFASDWSGDGSTDSDAWSHTGDANAVSPDNIGWWDSPGPGNQGQFSSVYGHREELFYRPGTYARVPVYRWRRVATRGNLAGRVIANADVGGAEVDLLGSGMDAVVVTSNGEFRFDDVPAGTYTVAAGINIGGSWNSAEASVSITAGDTSHVDIALEPPPEVNRLVTVSVDMETNWSSVWAHSPNYASETKSVRVHPFGTHGQLEFEGSGTPRGKMIVDVDLNADLSVTASYRAQEIDDEVEGELRGGFDVARDWSSWRRGIVVSNDDPIDNDATRFDIVVTNDLATA